MQTKAAVVRNIDQLTIETVELAPPGPGELLVRMRAAGVCHSDLHAYQGQLQAVLPLVLGHEGAGVVEAVGPGVTRVKAGDPILINWLPTCETCLSCLNGQANLCHRLLKTTFKGRLVSEETRIQTLDGLPLNRFLSAATMSEYMVISEASAIPIPDNMPFEVAAIIGCAVATGVGAVINTAQVPTGSSAAVIGCGGIGLSLIQGCKLAGCHPIVAVDMLDSKLEFARQMGATDTLNASEVNMVRALRKLVRPGPDYIFDGFGSATTIPQALQAVRPGGTAVIVGLHAAKIEVSIPAAVLVLHNKRLIGSFAGSIRPQLDLPKLIKLYQAGRLQLDKLITHRYPLEALPQAFADMKSGTVARGVIMFE